jgi:hypothetical protein
MAPTKLAPGNTTHNRLLTQHNRAHDLLEDVDTEEHTASPGEWWTRI